ncbi:MAG: type I DNA topoisomerase [Candidatus Delongbacteria bacterium]|jgi:DNA topoisomerase-1|nr:type I DNA topoisomerase [Candidatus Delongbacteria bacterium]MDD4204870.1 type I DNA topoisomerase [Candidatus Delongbacteria bacterium]MDY0017129.1 type I DNA topoisomerase [Candidatus Delongbacteria bacterium]
MGKNLVILESPGKVKAVSKYLGNSYNVIASNGHVIDLPPKELGVDIENDFKPTYKIIDNAGQASKIMKKIETMAKESDKILIATDPDREGEAIGWHISNRLKEAEGRIVRVTFNEITKKGIEAGLKNEGTIDKNLVDAQQSRRIMDRLVGYKISPFLWKAISNGLSAGRVQSVALRIICERDKDVNGFVPEEYWTVKAEFSTSKEQFYADLVKIDDKDFRLANKSEAEKIITDIRKSKYSVLNINKTKVKKSPMAPFITSTLLQASVNRLGFSSKKTMQIAQNLYEGIELGTRGVVGLITYMRTDSTRVSNDAVDEVRDYISKKFGVDFVTPSARKYKSKKNIQDAHEAIRPADINLEPKKLQPYLSKEQFRLYQLIWTRFVATQMKEALFEQTVIDIGSSKFKFRISARKNIFKGYQQVFVDSDFGVDKEDEDSNTKLPKKIDVGMMVTLNEVESEEHFTKPPARFNEASLTKELEEQEIGRPSTYATIIDRLIYQKYIEKSEKKLISTELGNLVNNILVDNFGEIFNIKFTKKMEASLDKIEYGEAGMLEILNKFYKPFEKTLEAVSKKTNEIKKTTELPAGGICPRCGKGSLIFKWGKNGKFIACSNFPACKYTASLDQSEGGSESKKDGSVKTAPKKEFGKCPKCGKGTLVERTGRFGRKFIACDMYPKCKYIHAEHISIKCPVEGCDGTIKDKTTKKGRLFYGCSNFPKCTFASWNKPVEKKCPSCGYGILEEVTDQKTSSVKYVCPNCKKEFEDIKI